MDLDYKYLNKIEYPADLRKLDVEVLSDVCSELRDDIVKELSVNPGHLASSLGVTELTVALHYVYDTPNDRIVWDVGHQAYGHKILTGRREVFSTNRKLGGLHPFPCPQESEYDTFTCGHASNSISAALGMAVADNLEGRKRHVVAVIGDGSMSGGLAFEGLNNVSSSPNDLLIILNDNNMSIDRSVGGMKQYLLSLNTNESYNRWRNKIAGWLKNRGWLDENTRKKTIRMGNALKSALSPQANVFEGMNIRYFGPVDGNDVKELVRVLRQLKTMSGPKLLHIHTIKGKGYEPAEKSATIWHAPGKFDAKTGERIKDSAEKKTVKYQEVFGRTLVELARENKKIVGVTPAMPTGCSMNIMMDEMPDRAFDVGIAEGHAVTFSAGMAKEGLVPFCNIYSAFAQRAYDNIIHDVAIEKLNVVMCLDRAGIVGEDGATHHGAFDLAALRPIPNLTICAPMNEHELRRMMYTAQLPDQGPVVIRYPRGRGVIEDWQCPLEPLEVGKGREVPVPVNVPVNANPDIAVLSIGTIGNNVQRALTMLTPEERARVVHYDMRYLKPLDTSILNKVGAKCKRIITVEDGVKEGGLGSAVLEYLTDHDMHPVVVRLGMPSTQFVEHGTVEQLQHLVGIDAEGIAEKLRS
ncbi:MAG: 1-deoxy-D-xylulose-5-phosphate synthase [Prevotella sp.]|nr:1-deoxy-D-xylulose-5-phosphate synthase [Prevotella sp.]MBQ9560794.1 1-deoxy-D-xylulose-5-phosphate synthase [Prevotella sp.]